MIKSIQESSLLATKFFGILELLSKELEETFNSVQVHRTRTEMEVSVLNNLKYPTPASKYWQSVREQSVMFEGVAMLSFDYRKEKVNIKILSKKIKVETDELEKELLSIELERKMFILNNMERSAKAKVREIQDWSAIKSREAAKMSKEELANVGNHQLISYTRRWINQTIEMGDSGSPSERQNLLGQLRSGINLCIKTGIIHEVLKVYETDIKEQILLEYGVR